MYRSEHPNPQFEREQYECLNGAWDFEIGSANGRLNTALSGKIEVPFCPESKLSGVGMTDFIRDCVYSREIEVNEQDLEGRLVLHFGAVDYEAQVYVNGQYITAHVGGYTSFEADITSAVHIGTNRITVAVHDDMREHVPSGKQSRRRNSFGCFYTRTTGIWQTVWLERTPKTYVKSIRIYPDIQAGVVKVEVNTEGSGFVEIAVLYEGRQVGEITGDMAYRHNFTIPLRETHLWSPGEGKLYDVVLRFGTDLVKSYFGLREVGYQGRKFLVNGKSVFQRFVLDQGYYPDGIYTAPDLETMRQDIEKSVALGFNGARLHQKVFEQRFLYECDRAGYMVWGEFPSWGVEYEKLDFLGRFISEWTEVVEQYFNHPSIITWCPLNEVWSNLEDQRKVRNVRFVESVYAVTKMLDGTRPCVDTSGGYHGRHTDVFDFHCYGSEEDIIRSVERLEQEEQLITDTLYPPDSAQENILYQSDVPVSASEYGGIAYSQAGDSQIDLSDKEDKAAPVTAESGWGYSTCSDEERLVDQYVGQTRRFLSCRKISGFCYTQLYDVEQEENGFYTYFRLPKLGKAAMQRIADCNRSRAAIEEM